jgi:hypothetical protein
MQNLNKKLGLDQLEAYSEDQVISTNESNPTVFTSEKRIIIPRGETLSGIGTPSTTLPTNLTAITKTRDEGILKRNIFAGKFFGEIDYLEWSTKIKMEGAFHIHIS